MPGSRARVLFQADYEVLSSQFAGLVVAHRHGLFTKKGIDVVMRGRVRPGSEADVVVAMQETAKLLTPTTGASAPPTLALGCAEQCVRLRQFLYCPLLHAGEKGKTHTPPDTRRSRMNRNIVLPAQAGGAKVKVVSAMFQKSPLGLGLRPDSTVESLRSVRDGSMECVCVSLSVSHAPPFYNAHPAPMQGPGEVGLPRGDALRLPDARAGNAPASRRGSASHKMMT